MSAHEKENGKGAEPDWVGLSCDADGQTEQRGSQSVKEVTLPHRLRSERAERIHPSATVWSGLRALIFSSSPRPC